MCPLECFFRPKKPEDSQPSWLSSPSTCWVFLARWSPIDGCLCLLLGQYRAVFRKPKCSEGVIDNSINAAQFLLFEHPFAKVFVRCFLVEVYGWSDASTDVIYYQHVTQVLLVTIERDYVVFLWSSKLQKNNEIRRKCKKMKYPPGN